MTGSTAADTDAVDTGAGRDGPAWLAGRRLDWLVTSCVLWGTTGLVLDVRSHIEGFSFAEEGFITPEHTVIYSGFLAVAVLLAAAVQRNRWRGEGWREAVPAGYGLGIVGLAAFAAAGPADALWHAAFGAEADVEALASPTHLALATGGTLFCTSPLRATLHRTRRGDVPDSWAAQGPLVVAGTLTVVVAAVFTVFAQPGFLLAGDGSGFVPHELAGLLLSVALLAGAVLFLATRLRLVPGAVTLLVAVPAVATAYLGANPWLVPWYVGGAALGEVGATGARRRFGARPATLLTGAAVPAAFVASHFAALWARGELAWTVHLWVGAVFLAAVVGAGQALLAAPRPGVAEPAADSHAPVD